MALWKFCQVLSSVGNESSAFNKPIALRVNILKRQLSKSLSSLNPWASFSIIMDINTLIEALGVPFPSENKGLKIVSSILFVTFSQKILCQEFVSS